MYDCLSRYLKKFVPVCFQKTWPSLSSVIMLAGHSAQWWAIASYCRTMGRGSSLTYQKTKGAIMSSQWTTLLEVATLALIVLVSVYIYIYILVVGFAHIDIFGNDLTTEVCVVNGVQPIFLKVYFFVRRVHTPSLVCFCVFVNLTATKLTE